MRYLVCNGWVVLNGHFIPYTLKEFLGYSNLILKALAMTHQYREDGRFKTGRPSIVVTQQLTFVERKWGFEGTRCGINDKGYAKKKSSTRGPFIWIRYRRPSPPPPLPSKKGNKSRVNCEDPQSELGQVSAFVAVFDQRSLYHHHFATFIITMPLTNGSLSQPTTG